MWGLLAAQGSHGVDEQPVLGAVHPQLEHEAADALGAAVNVGCMNTVVNGTGVHGNPFKDLPKNGLRLVKKRIPVIDALRELCGGGIFQMPADVTVMHDPRLRQQFEAYWQTPQLAALERMKLYKLAWDLIGSEFAGRHLQYEKFYAGASFIVRNHSFRETPWAHFHAVVDELMASYDVPPKDAERKVA
jgi:hypothetical protein